MVCLANLHSNLFAVKVFGRWIKYDHTLNARLHELAEDEDILQLRCFQLLQGAIIWVRRAKLATMNALRGQITIWKSRIDWL